jgi:carotenoid cleavage dioxygenase-like enzyme
VAMPEAHILHDMAITERYSVLLDFPLGWDKAKLKEGKRRIGFDRDTPSRFGVLPRHGHASDIRWFEAKPCYVYHVVNSYEDGDDLVVLACRVADPIPEKQSESTRIARLDTIELVPHLYEWRLHLKTGQVSERQLDDAATEFPRINDTVQGKKARYSYHPRIAPRPDLMFDGLIRYDLATGAKQAWSSPPGWYIGEASFAPAPNAASEDHGWLITYGTHAAEKKSAAFILDARDLASGPVATVELPQRIPLGFHSYWCPGA